ncbi:MAG: Hpt domain-containing protein, partial [Steroidobacteraceae bacterium]
MSLDLSQFHAAFFEESFEALDAMEAALLELDTGAPDPEKINTIFRVAHSIKGGSATFGFGEIASFTHSLETLLDELRGNRLAVSDTLSNLLLRSVDVMRDMLRAVQGKLPTDAQRVADLQFDLELAIARKDAAPTEPRRAEAERPGVARWRIGFRPYPQFFARGNDPLRMFRELAALGSLEVTTNAIELPALAELDPQACQLAWAIDLSGSTTEEAIREVFDWATGESDLEVRCLSGSTEGGESAPPDSSAHAPANAQSAADAHAAPGTHAAADRHTPADAQLASSMPLSAHTPAAPDAPAKVAPPRVADIHGKAELPGITGVGDSGSIRVSVEKIDELMNTVGELVITQAMLSQLERSL